VDPQYVAVSCFPVFLPFLHLFFWTFPLTSVAPFEHVAAAREKINA